jgi:pimeloyl-ACP methyl ester carboxylesterase
MSGLHYGPENPNATYVPHGYPEHSIDLGEVTMNYAVAGDPDLPALLLVPGQVQSWWSYEDTIARLEKHFQVFAVDLRGQGRSTRTPGRYTFDNMGNDLVRFIALVIGRSAIVSGHSSGGLLALWLSAYGLPGSIRGVLCEDPPIFAAEATTSCGDSLGQNDMAQLFAIFSKFLGDQWSVGDWAGLQIAIRSLPPPFSSMIGTADTPPQSLREYDPEWARACCSGTIGASCDHARMLAAIKTPVLFTHHFRMTDPETGKTMGAASDRQADYACRLMRSTGQQIDYRSFPEMGHSMHAQNLDLFAQTLLEWTSTLG